MENASALPSPRFEMLSTLFPLSSNRPRFGSKDSGTPNPKFRGETEVLLYVASNLNWQFRENEKELTSELHLSELLT